MLVGIWSSSLHEGIEALVGAFFRGKKRKKMLFLAGKIVVYLLFLVGIIVDVVFFFTILDT